jgi:hypothetical protein
LKIKKEKISQYLYAKDNNKPHLMKDVFVPNAKLDIRIGELKSNNISFPSQTISLCEITKVLINNFNKTYENVYTFCLDDTFVENKII